MISRPKYFMLSVTNVCNKNCPYCVVKDYVNKPDEYPDDLDKDMLMAYLGARLRANDVVEITGGEPTSLEWIWELVEFLDNMNVTMIMRTNGWKLKKNEWPNLLVVLNPHDEGATYEESRRSLLRETDIVIHPELVEPGSMEPRFRTDDDSPVAGNGFGECRLVCPDGKIRWFNCEEDAIGWIGGDWDTECENDGEMCPTCPFGDGVWNLAVRLKPGQYNIIIPKFTDIPDSYSEETERFMDKPEEIEWF